MTDKYNDLEFEINKILSEHGQPPIYAPNPEKEKKRIKKEKKAREEVRNKAIAKKLNTNKTTMWKLDEELVKFINEAVSILRQVEKDNIYVKKYKKNKLYDSDIQDFIQEIQCKCNDPKLFKKSKKKNRSNRLYDDYGIDDVDFSQNSILQVSLRNDREKIRTHNLNYLLKKDIDEIKRLGLEDSNYDYKYSINMEDKVFKKYYKGKNVDNYELVFPYDSPTRITTIQEYVDDNEKVLGKTNYFIVRKKIEKNVDTSEKSNKVIIFDCPKKELSNVQKLLLKSFPKVYKISDKYKKHKNKEDREEVQSNDNKSEEIYMYKNFVVPKDITEDQLETLKWIYLEENKPKKCKKLRKMLEEEKQKHTIPYLTKLIAKKYYPKELKKELRDMSKHYLKLCDGDVLLAQSFYRREAYPLANMKFWFGRLTLLQDGLIRSILDFSDIDGCDYTDYLNQTNIRVNKYSTYYDSLGHDINDLSLKPDGKISLVPRGKNENGMSYDLKYTRGDLSDYLDDENGNGWQSYIGRYTDEEVEYLSKRDMLEAKQYAQQESVIDKFINDPNEILNPYSKNSLIRDRLNEEFETTNKKKNKKNKNKSLTELIDTYNDKVDKKKTKKDKEKKKSNDKSSYYLIKKNKELFKKWHLDKKIIKELESDSLFKIYLANRESYTKKQQHDADLAASIYAEEKLYKVSVPDPTGSINDISTKQITKMNTLIDMIPMYKDLKIE